MAETTPTLDWTKLLDPDYIPIGTEDPPASWESEISPSMAGAGFGAVLAVPAFLVIVAKFLPANFSDSALVYCALAAPALGGAFGAFIAMAGAAMFRKFVPVK